jgi:hypothetical protein|tara:strand:- start:19674 stop:20801 length:1128 start_codon:yes stop_codon:yes gene_type:complete
MSSIEYPKIIIVGPPRTGKSSILDALESLDKRIVRGEKYKLRKNYEYWSEDGKQKDSLPILSEQQLSELRNSGRIAFEYRSVDTRHFVTREDAERTDVYVTYISDSNDGAQAFRHHFRNSIIFYLYNKPSVISHRLIRSNLPEEQIKDRLAFYKAEFALFTQNSQYFHFPFATRDRYYSGLDYSYEEIKQRIQEDVNEDARRMLSLMDFYHKYHMPGISVADLHNAYIEYQIRKLTNVALRDLIVILHNKKSIPIDLEPELTENCESLPDHFKSQVKNPKVIGYSYENGRHTIFLEGLIIPGVAPHTSVIEDIVLRSITQRLGKPTARRNLDEHAGFYNQSDYGLINVYNALLRDGLFYSLGDLFHKFHSTLVLL